MPHPATLRGLSSRTAAVQPPVRDAAGRAALARYLSDDKAQSIQGAALNDTSRCLSLFIYSSHTPLPSLPHTFFARAALSITRLEIAVTTATAIQLLPHHKMSTPLISLYYCLRVETLGE